VLKKRSFTIARSPTSAVALLGIGEQYRQGVYPFIIIGS
jgi:hypothetical protein